jgi:hypothetical protein
MAALSSTNPSDKPRYAEYITNVHQERVLLDSKATSVHHIEWMQQCLTQLTLNSRDPTADISVKSVATEIQEERKKLGRIVSNLCTEFKV